MTWARRRLALSLAVAAATLAAPRTSRADDRDALAAKSFRAGETAYERGEYQVAAIAFEEANRQSPRGAATYNAALAWEFAKAPARAADDFAAALRQGGLSDAQERDARTRLAALDDRLGLVEVTAPKGAIITVGTAVAARAPTAAHALPGEVVVRIELSDGAVVTRAVAVRAHATEHVDIAPPAGIAAERRPVMEARGPAAVTWVFGAGAVAASGLAIGLGVAALGARDDFDASGHTDAGARDSASTLRTGTNVAWVSAGAFAVTAVVLFVVTRHGAGSSATARLPQLGRALF